jgi:hypothetical protein
MSLPKKFQAVLRFDLLLALNLVAPWYLLLFSQCCFYVVDSAIPITFQYSLESAKPAIPERDDQTGYPGVFSAILAISVCVLGLAKITKRITRARAASKAAGAEEMASRCQGMNDFERKVSSAELWHGRGQTPMAQKKAAKHHGLGQDSLKRLLDRAFKAYNDAHVHKKLNRLEDFRSIPVTVFKQYLSPIEMGRGDTLSPWEFEEIKSRYITRCRNYKDVPESQLTNDSKNDEFAAVINEVFGESRVELKRKKTVEEYSNFCIRKWAKAMEVVSTGTVPGSDSRSSAVGDWRNMISSLVMWLAVVTGFSKRIPVACQYNMDDTTVFLEQRIGKRKRTYVAKSVKDALHGKNLSFSFGVTKSKREKQRKKAANTQARTVKILFCSCADGTPVCTVVKIKDESITQFKLQKITDSFYIVWDPKIPKSGPRSPAEPKSVRVRRTATIMKFAILPAIVLDMEVKRRKQAEAYKTFDEEGVAHDSLDSHADDVCYDRALLSFDGDFAQVEAILALEDVTAAFAAKNVELFKFAAGASMTQQPNDRSRCFYCLKKALSEQRVKIQEDIDIAMSTLSPKYLKMLRELSHRVPDKGKSKTSHATFKFFLSSCDSIFNSAFSISNIRGGWKKCGLSPFNPQVMMESYAFFEDLRSVAPDAPQQVLAAVPRLAGFARDSGFISDEQMEAELGALFRQSPAYALQYARDSAGARAPVNHRRCIWLSNPVFLDSERAKRAAAAVVPPRPASAAARARPRQSSSGAAVEALPAAAAAFPSAPEVEILWCFPCTWTSAAGVVIDCGSKDKKKSQHVKSDQHALFLRTVAQLQTEEAAELAWQRAHNIFGSDDPLDAVDLGQMLNEDDNNDDDDDSDSSYDDDLSSVFHVTPCRASPIGGGGAAPYTGNAALPSPGYSTRSRSHSRTPTRVHFADDELSTTRQRVQ